MRSQTTIRPHYSKKTRSKAVLWDLTIYSTHQYIHAGVRIKSSNQRRGFNKCCSFVYGMNWMKSVVGVCSRLLLKYLIDNRKFNKFLQSIYWNVIKCRQPDIQGSSLFENYISQASFEMVTYSNSEISHLMYKHLFFLMDLRKFSALGRHFWSTLILAIILFDYVC